MKHQLKNVLFGVLLCCFACQSQKTKQTDQAIDTPKVDSMCVSFDQRQCMSDEFAAFLPSDKNQDGMFDGMQTYLSQKEIAVLHLRIDLNYHESTCAACDVCPEQHRFFLSLESSEFKKLMRLNLMHLEPVDCHDYF